MSVLQSDRLSVGYRDGDETLTALSEVTLALCPGRLVGLTGESGAGKSTLALALMGYRTQRSLPLGGSVRYGELDLAQLDRAALRGLWGRRIAMLPQDCASSLNPALRLAGQLEEVLATHAVVAPVARRERALELLARAGIENPEQVVDRYPHELSGGEQQRAALALALCCEPEVLILDEPTASLDDRAQQGVLELLAALGSAGETAVLLISHDLALLGSVCDELYVMYAGQIVERGPAAAVWTDPEHPYTAALRAAIPSLSGGSPPRGLLGAPPPGAVTTRCAFSDRCDFSAPDCLAPVALVARPGGRDVRCVRPGISQPPSGVLAARSDESTVQPAPIASITTAPPLLSVGDLSVRYGERPALTSVSLTLCAGGALGIAGPSGAGKSTLLRTIAGLQRASNGTVRLSGEELSPAVAARTRTQRQAIQIVFQNPDATLNPRHSVATALGRPLALFRPELPRRERRAVAAAVLDRVWLSSRLLERHPAELSAGQRQRVAIARALLAQPRLLLVDEPTSALDLSAQAAVLELLGELRAADGLALIFVSHDLAVLRYVSDELALLEEGAIGERGSTAQLLTPPLTDSAAEPTAAPSLRLGDRR